LISCNKYEKEKKEELPIARQIHQVPLLVDEEMVDELCFTCKMISCKRNCHNGRDGWREEGRISRRIDMHQASWRSALALCAGPSHLSRTISQHWSGQLMQFQGILQ
jgi:hypothetical protein